MRPFIGITSDVDETHLKISRHYTNAVEEAGACPLILAPSANIAGLALKIDGLLIPGGNDIDPFYYNEDISAEIKIVDRARTGFEFAILREIIRLRKPVLGICYGMQLINVALGGSLYQDIKSQMPEALDHKGDSHSIRAEDNRFFGGGEFIVNSSHHQAVKILGNGLEAIASAVDGIAEAVSLAGYPFLVGVQWHPERSKDALSKNIFRVFAEASLGKR